MTHFRLREILECAAVDPVVQTDGNGGRLPAGCKASPQVLTRSIFVKRAPMTFASMGGSGGGDGGPRDGWEGWEDGGDRRGR